MALIANFLLLALWQSSRRFGIINRNFGSNFFCVLLTLEFHDERRGFPRLCSIFWIVKILVLMRRFQGFMRFNLILRLLWFDCDLKIGFDEEWWGMAFCVCVACYWTCSVVGSCLVRVFLGRHSCYWKCQEVQSSPVHVCNVWADSFFLF